MSNNNSSNQPGEVARSAATPRDLPASIHGRLKNISRSHGEDMLYVLSRYALERLLYRLGCSPYAEQFVVKGALVFTLWRDQPHRPTRDLDLLGIGSDDAERIQGVFADLCVLPVAEPDGLVFQPQTLKVIPIRETQTYAGLRVTLQATLGTTRIRVQVDIGFGDVVTPGATFADFPSLIGLPSPRVRAYPPETVVAEKYEALVRLGAINSRMKDFYDVWALARERAFSGVVLAEAIHATFTRRGTSLSESIPLALSDAFVTDPAKLQLWQAFVTRTRLEPAALTLASTLELLRLFLLPPTHGVLSTGLFDRYWRPGGPWEVAGD